MLSVKKPRRRPATAGLTRSSTQKLLVQSAQAFKPRRPCSCIPRQYKMTLKSRDAESDAPKPVPLNQTQVNYESNMTQKINEIRDRLIEKEKV